MALGGRLKGLLGGGEPAAGPLGLGIGRAIELEAGILASATGDLWFTLPEGPLPLTAAGRIDFGDGSFALRYYTDEHEMLQVICADGAGEEHIQEVKFFVPLGAIYPEDDEWPEWEGENSPVGQLSYTLDDGPEYQREWFKEDPGWAAPVSFAEQVTDSAGARSEIRQHVMLFARALPSLPNAREYLLLSLEEHPDGRSVEAMVGIDLEPSMFRVL